MLRGSASLCWIVISFLPGWAAAQDTAKKSPPKPATVRVAFDGGTLAAYVEVVKKQFPNTNIVVDPPAEKVVLPKVVLPALAAVRPALEWPTRVAEGRRHGVVLQPPLAVREGQVVYVLTVAQPPPMRSVVVREEPQLRTYNLSSEVRPGVQPEELKTFVHETLKARRPDFNGPVSYNEKNGMLTVIGFANDLRAADSIVEEKTRSQRVAAVLPSLQAEMKGLQVELKRLQERVDKLGPQGPDAGKPATK